MAGGSNLRLDECERLSSGLRAQRRVRMGRGSGLATQITAVMFTDLVDSTAAMSSLGEAASEALRREHFTLLREAIAAGGGREVKNLGDGIYGRLPGAPSDAVRAAMAGPAFPSARRNRASHPPSPRFGWGSHWATPMSRTATTSVYRWCRQRDVARADGGEILVGDVVRLLAGTRAEGSSSRSGIWNSGGSTSRLTTWRVPWAVDEATPERPALPARLASARVPQLRRSQ